MNIRTDIVKMYKEVHGWVGIISGLALFIAFYAGAITMFEEPLQSWASPPIDLAAPVPLERAPELVDKLIAAHPEAANSYAVNVEVDGNRPARVSWRARGEGGLKTRYAGLDAQDELQVSGQELSPVGQFIDVLHQKVGLPLPSPAATPIMGAIAFLYCIAIASGLVVLLPSLVRDLFALRLGNNLKRMWLDVHNLLGVFSLPFHIVMAVTSVGFAFYPYYHASQKLAFGYQQVAEEHAVHGSGPILTPKRLVERVNEQLPGFEVVQISYARKANGALEVHVSGRDPRYGVFAASLASADVNAYTGEFTHADYMPRLRKSYGSIMSNYIALHLGSYGGAPVRWLYFLLGLAGAALFYTGNLLWIESRRKKERKAGLPQQTRATRILGALTIGVPLGCIAGISMTVSAAKILGTTATADLHSLIYYTVFVVFTAYALARGAARSAVHLLWLCAVVTLAIPLTTVLAALFPAFGMWAHGSVVTIGVDVVAFIGALCFAWVAIATARRVKLGPADSIWSIRKPEDRTAAHEPLATAAE